MVSNQGIGMIVRLSLLTMTNPNQIHELLLFVCSKRRPMLALNCLLQIEQERSEEKSPVGDVFALAFRWAHFCSASLILSASYSPAPLFVRPRNFARSCAICYHHSFCMLKSSTEALRVSLYRFWPPRELFPTFSSPQRIFFAKCSSGIMVTWPVHFKCADFRRVCTICTPARFRTSCLEFCLATL